MARQKASVHPYADGRYIEKRLESLNLSDYDGDLSTSD